MKKKLSLKRSLYISYSKIVISIMVLFFVVFLIFYSYSTLSNTFQQQEALIEAIENAVLLEIEKISTVSMNVLYSQQIWNSLNAIDFDKAQMRRADPIFNSIASIIGPNKTVTQINIHTQNGHSVGWGVFELFGATPLNIKNDNEDVLALNGRRYWDVPVLREDFAYYSSYLRDNRYISMHRAYFDRAHNPRGVLEIVQDCKIMFAYPDRITNGGSSIRLFIVNERDEILYPYDLTEQELKPNPITVIDEAAILRQGNMIVGITKQRELVSYSIMQQTGWRIILIETIYSKFAFLIAFTSAYILTAAGIIFFVIIICRRVSDKVLRPLYELKDRIRHMNLHSMLEGGGVLPPIATETIEIKDFMDEFDEMYQKLEKSTKDLSLAKDEENHAKMTAMQSMLNPHFIYNNLANISVMAEEGMCNEVVSLSENLCDYLRYISTDSMITVTLNMELDYTRKYLECMKVRYGDRLQYMFDIFDRMHNLKIPKLILQPIIENSFKYAFHNEPPWIINVSGCQDDSGWRISICDNGIGMPAHEIDEIRRLLDEAGKSKNIRSLKIGGMGLMNVYLRLSLLYGDNAGIHIENRNSGGVCVMLFGPNSICL
ncbi:MAG: histidine kinase [Oscillospiraceae bacterium]|nr:histidine kinase [Oscillospiraceae bacterium]